MERRLGPFRVEYAGAENSKFTAPMLLLHGLWDRAESWRLFSGFLSHRGWRCAAINLRSAETGATSIADLSGGLSAAIAALGTAPVVLGHDLGGMLALRLCREARAVVALAPLGAGAQPALEAAGSWLARRRGVDLSAPRGPWRAAYTAAAQVKESPLLLAEAAGRVVVPPSPVPALVVSGNADPLLALDEARALATGAAADLEIVAGGHRLHCDERWEERVAIVHRWLVRGLGTDLLALYEEAMADREAE